MQDSNTDRMTHNVYELVEYASHMITLNPGDLISSGSPAGVGTARATPIYFKDGDTSTCTIESDRHARKPRAGGEVDAMPSTTRLFGLLLIVLGIASYVVTERTSVTALIPAFFGAVLVVWRSWRGTKTRASMRCTRPSRSRSSARSPRWFAPFRR